MTDDHLRGGVELTIPKMTEVEIFRTNPSLWWMPQAKPMIPVEMLIASKGPFLKMRFPQKAQKKFGTPFQVFEGSHMFPLEHPVEVAEKIKTLLLQ